MAARLLNRAAVVGIRLLTALTDAIPAKYRFGHWNRLLRLLAIPSGLPSVVAPEGEPGEAEPSAQARRLLSAGAVHCVLVAGAMDSGGVEAVVEALALGLPQHGLHVDVVATMGGAAADRLRSAGIGVTVISPERTAEHLRTVQPDVIQLHRAGPELVTALLPFRERTVPVFHALESYLGDRAWESVAELVGAAPASIAVSDAVARFVAERAGGVEPRTVVNGVRHPGIHRMLARSVARKLVAGAVPDLRDEDILVVALQRYSDQKNAAGLVDAFLLAAEREPRLRLVLAGGPSSWLEVRRADVLRRAHPMGDRVHLLGESDPWVLFAGADVYALNSFSEGGPISAVEAVACGLPVVLSDVGYTRKLVEAADGWGEVVPGALPDASQHELARARRARHQTNREEFARALLAASRLGRREAPATPALFTEPAMVANHAEILQTAARQRRLRAARRQ